MDHTTSYNKGLSYEYYIYDHIKNLYEYVWHSTEISEKIFNDLYLNINYITYSTLYRYDIGFDILAYKNNEYYYIQCKNYNSDLCISDLSGFTWFLASNNKKNGIVYYNYGINSRIKNTNMCIEFIHKPYEEIIKNEIIINNIMIPKEYQIEAYNTLKHHNKVILSLPCGMGKTYIASMLVKDYDNIILLSPLKVLANELLNNIDSLLDNKYNKILICSESERNINKLKIKLRTNNIISSTYKSSDVLYELLLHINHQMFYMNCYYILIIIL
jgi:predicted helicase